MLMPFFIVSAAIALFLIVFLLRAVYLVRQSEAIVIERLGRYHRTLGPGLHILMPFMERPRSVFWTFVREHGHDYMRYTVTTSRIDLRESVYDFPKQNVITRDNVTIEINALLYYWITDPHAAVYEVSNLPQAIEKLTQTTLRNVIGSLDLDEVLVSRDQINHKLRIILDDATDKWGIKVNRVELQEVNPPADIRNAMEKQMRAERDRRAKILEAEGTKGAAILKAEGEREADILEAEGEGRARVIAAESEAEARLKIMQAEAQAIEYIRNALQADPMAYLIAINYIKVLPEMMKGKDNKMIVVPYESAALSGSLAMLKNIFEKQ